MSMNSDLILLCGVIFEMNGLDDELHAIDIIECVNFKEFWRTVTSV